VAYIYTKNSTPGSGADAIFNLKTALKASGWTVTKSSDGVTFNASGDQITTGTTGAGGMKVVKAWFVIRQPAATFGSSREFLFQNADATGTSFRIKYSQASGFSGGSPAILVTPSAADETALLGAGTDAAPTFATLFPTNYGGSIPARQQILVNNAAPHEWYTSSQPQGGGDTTNFLAMDVMVTGSFDVLDVDPYVLLIGQGASMFNVSNFYSGEVTAKAWYRKGLSGALFTAISASQYVFGATGTLAVTLGTNGYNGKDVVLPILFARNLASTTAVGLKGQSTLMKWVTNSRPAGDTLTVVSTSDNLCLASGTNVIAVPWDGTVPLV
jgi:hypothetical protein